jgi:MATE family multidrug resistance protein
MLHPDRFKAIYRLAGPVIIGQLGHIGMSVVDNMMVGAIGAGDLAAAALANSVFVLFLVVGLGVTFAISPLVSASLSTNEKATVEAILPNGFWLNMAVGLVLFLLMSLSILLLPLLGQNPEVTQKAESYLFILALSIVPLMAFQTFKQFIEGFQFMYPAMFITISANVINYAGNKIFIFGAWHLPAYGLDGAGYSTLITRLAMAVAIILFVRRSRRMRIVPLSLLRFKPDFRLIRRIFNIGIGSGFQYFFEVGCFTLAVVMVGWLGKIPQAAHQISLNLASVSYMFAIGLSAATAILIGKAYGRNDWHVVKSTGETGIMLGALNMAVFGVVFVVFNTSLPRLYINDPAVIEVASGLLLMAAVFQIFDGAQGVAIGVLRGITDVQIPTLITFVSYWPIALGAAYIGGFVLAFGALGIWFGLTLGLGVAAALLYWRFRFLCKKHT